MARKKKQAVEITFNESVTKGSLEKLKERIKNVLTENNGADIILLISSVGGDPFTAFGFYDWVELKGISLTTVALGNTDSAAIIIFLAGKRRIAGKHTIFRFHEFTLSIKDAKFSVSELHQTDLESKKGQDIYIRIVSERCGKSIRKVRNVMKNRVAMNTEDAKAFGLIHEIK